MPIGNRTAKRVEFDVDAIRDVLTVEMVLEEYGTTCDAGDTARCRCPFCNGGTKHEDSFSVFGTGQRWECKRRSCDEGRGCRDGGRQRRGGDAIELLRRLYPEETWPQTMSRAAALTGIDAGPVDPIARAYAARARAERRAAAEESERVRKSEACKQSTRAWHALLGARETTPTDEDEDRPQRTCTRSQFEIEQRRLAKLHEWLHHRGLDALIDVRNDDGKPWRRWTDRRLWWAATSDERGQLVLPIFADDDIARGEFYGRMCGSSVVGLATRMYERSIEHEHDIPGVTGPSIVWNDEPRGMKTLTREGSSTEGVFGQPSWIGHISHRCVVCVGQTDFMAAHLAFPDHEFAIIGANGDGRIDVAMRVACRRLVAAHTHGWSSAAPEILLVTDDDKSGRDARTAALAVARAVPTVHVTDHDLGGYHDLCDQVAERERARRRAA